jgi:4-hydroxy-tetrahydrodipicolinate synthase
VHGVICTGSTGEFASLSDEERELVISTTVEAAAGRVPVLAGASANSSSDVVRYCHMAEQAGADGLMLVHPYYCLPSQRELYEHYKYVAERVSLPIMVYNNPFTSGVDITPEILEKLSHIENIRYVKECSGDATRAGQILRLCKNRLKVFAGADDVFLEAFVHGASGWVCGSANVFPAETAHIFRIAVEEGDFVGAREYASRLYPFLFMVEREGAFVQYLKAAMKLINRSMGKPRRPMLEVTEETRQRLAEAMKLVKEKP